MITKERLSYITSNLVIGDKKEIAKTTNVPYSTVDNILKSRCYGKNGDVVTNAAELLIKQRLDKMEKERLLYSNMNKEAVVS